MLILGSHTTVRLKFLSHIVEKVSSARKPDGHDLESFLLGTKESQAFCMQISTPSTFGICSLYLGFVYKDLGNRDGAKSRCNNDLRIEEGGVWRNPTRRKKLQLEQLDVWRKNFCQNFLKVLSREDAHPTFFLLYNTIVN